MITNKQLAKNALQAYLEGRLAAQHLQPCLYVTPDGSRCALGVSMLPDVKIEEEDNHRHIHHIKDRISYFGDEIEDLVYARRLQAWHDRWSKEARGIISQDLVTQTKLKFLSIIDETIND